MMYWLTNKFSQTFLLDILGIKSRLLLFTLETQFYKRQIDKHKHTKASAESAQTLTFVSWRWCRSHSCRLTLSSGIMGAPQWGQTWVCESGRPLSRKGEFLDMICSFSAHFKPSIQPQSTPDLLPAVGPLLILELRATRAASQSSSHPWSPA